MRTRFMMETINDLKNNKTRPGSGSFALRSEALVRMKKALGTLSSRKLRSTEPLRVDLRDVRNSEKRGNWWLPRGIKEDNNGRESEDELAAGSDAGSEAIDARMMDSELGLTSLLRLAKEQNMNTDVRRAIFVSIMSATDHRDAHIRLTKLHLKRAQEIEIPRVLIQCAGAEQAYNPYYTLVARKLCADRRLKMAFRFGLWGLFRAMGEEHEDDDGDGDGDEDRGRSSRQEEDADAMSTRMIVNLARMYGTLVAEGALGLVTLKVHLTPIDPWETHLHRSSLLMSAGPRRFLTLHIFSPRPRLSSNYSSSLSFSFHDVTVMMAGFEMKRPSRRSSPRAFMTTSSSLEACSTSCPKLLAIPTSLVVRLRVKR